MSVKKLVEDELPFDFPLSTLNTILFILFYSLLTLRVVEAFFLGKREAVWERTG